MTIATLLTPALAGLRAEHPEIRFDFAAQDNIVDLRARKADIALRFVKKPGQELIGQIICGVSWAVYASPKIAADISRQLRANGSGYLPLAPILTPDAPGRLPDWAEGRFSADCPCDYIRGFAAKLEMAARGFGVVLSPRYLGDVHKGLEILPDFPWTQPQKLWILANSDTQTSARIRLVKNRLISELRALAPRIDPDNLAAPAKS